MKLLAIDFETVWDSKTYTLRKMSGEEYINDPRFHAFGLCVMGVGTGDTPKWIPHDEIPKWVASVDWGNTALLAHNFMFDGAILAWRYGVTPVAIFDTLSMARAVHGVDAGGSLAKLAERYGLPPKGTAIHSTDGLRVLSPEIERELADYCAHDVVLCAEVFKRLMETGVPKPELMLIDMTIRMFLYPTMLLDTEKLEQHLLEVRAAKTNLLVSAGVDAKVLASNPQFAALLESHGVDVPMKISPTTGKETWALAKSDEGLKALAEHPDLLVQTLVAARLGTKSTLEETRTERFIGTAKRTNGWLPIPLKYWGARTGRWAGCLSAETEVLVYNRSEGAKTKRITDVMRDDLVWDGVDYVRHGGVQFSGYKEVITYDGITGTPDHQVFTGEHTTCALAEAMRDGARIMGAATPDSRAMERARATLKRS